MSQLKEWMQGGKISKLVVVITDKETGEHVERWQFDVCIPPVLFCLDLDQRLNIQCWNRLKSLARNPGVRALKKPATRRTVQRRKYIL